VLVALLVIATTHDRVVADLGAPAGRGRPPGLDATSLPAARADGRLAEVCVTALGASTLAAAHTGSTASALLPYLTVPVVVPALEAG
jgi:hypothetical protein